MNDNTLKGNKKAIIGTIIGIVSMLIIIVGATYAYWNAREAVNFNTSTITYETRENSLIVLNGTSALLTLGTITGPDMKWSPNDVVYYAGEEDKTTTPTEVTVGVASYDNANDINAYRCQFTLNLTHGGTADIIDKFLSENYTNRSEGQIILTVNGEEYDLDDGFPSTITGYLDVNRYDDAPLNVGLKFVNLSDVDQDYLVNTNGYINVNVANNGFTCEAVGETRDIKYWAFVPDSSISVRSNPYADGTFAMKKYDDYHDLTDMVLYGIVSSEMGDNQDYVSYTFINEFSSLSDCNNFITNFPNNKNLYAYGYPLDYWECDYDSENSYYFITNDQNEWGWNGTPYRSVDVSVYNLFETEEDCEDFLRIVLNSDNFTNGNSSNNYVDIYDSSTLSCSQIEYSLPFFVRETVTPIISEDDKWELFYTNYTNGLYNRESACTMNVVEDTHIGINPNERSYCLYHNNYYYLQEQMVYGRLNFTPLTYGQNMEVYDDLVSDITGIYNRLFEPILFDSLSDCQSITNLFDSTFTDNNRNVTLDAIVECIKTRSAGEVYYETKLEMCLPGLYNENELVCFNIDENEFYENFSSKCSLFTTAGYYCDISENQYYYYMNITGPGFNIKLTKDKQTNSFGTHIFGDFTSDVYYCDWNVEYIDEMSLRCG